MFRRRRQPEEEPAQDVGDETRTELAQVRAFTIDETIDGWVDLDRQRLSDVLNAEDLLSVARSPHPSGDADWRAFEREQLFLVVPPPLSGEQRLRRHRVKRRLRAEIGHYRLEGITHLIAGIALDPFLARSRQHFLPVTDAWVTSTERPEVDEAHSALLINIRLSGHRLKIEVLE